MASLDIRKELERVQRRLEGAQVFGVECVLHTTKSAMFSRYPTRRIIPCVKSQRHTSQTKTIGGAGIGTRPASVECVGDLIGVVPLYASNGTPIVNSAGDPIYKNGGWLVSHRIELSGQSTGGVASTIEWVNAWAIKRIGWFQELGLLPTEFELDSGSLLWADVVLAMAEKSQSGLLVPTKWHVVIHPHLTVSLDSWRRKEHRDTLMELGEDWGLSQQQVAEIGDEPEDVEAERNDFLGDSLTTIEELIGILEASPQTKEQPTTPLEFAKTWLDKPRTLGGPTELQKSFVSQLIGGWMSHADLSVKGSFYWEDPRKGATNMAKRINERIDGKELWSIIPEDNSGCRIVLNSDLGKRS